MIARNTLEQYEMHIHIHSEVFNEGTGKFERGRILKTVIPFDIHLPDCFDGESFRMAISTLDHPFIDLKHFTHICAENTIEVVPQVDITTRDYTITLTEVFLTPTIKPYGVFFEIESFEPCTLTPINL